MRHKHLYIKEIKGKGRGVFCNKAIAQGETIEICPVIVVPAVDITVIQHSKLSDYSFYFNKEEDSLLLAMGFGSMYNHAQYPNAVFLLDRDNKTMSYTACQDIPAHMEILINYGGTYGHDYSKWFADRGLILFL